MSDFKTRLTIENDELLEKVIKLEDFLATEKANEMTKTN